MRHILMMAMQRSSDTSTPSTQSTGPGEHHARGARDHHEQDAREPLRLPGPIRRWEAAAPQAGRGGQAPALRWHGRDDHHGALFVLFVGWLALSFASQTGAPSSSHTPSTHHHDRWRISFTTCRRAARRYGTPRSCTGRCWTW